LPQIGVLIFLVPNLAFFIAPNRGLKPGSQIGVPNRGPKSGAQFLGPRFLGPHYWGPHSFLAKPNNIMGHRVTLLPASPARCRLKIKLEHAKVCTYATLDLILDNISRNQTFYHFFFSSENVWCLRPTSPM
jgi:hypothetical protein